MIYAVVVLVVLILTVTELLRSADGDIVKSLILAISKFICIFCVISLALFSTDHFSYRYALIAELILSLVYLTVVYVSGHKQLPFVFNGSSLWIPLIIICLTLPFTTQKAEYFGMGQDEGVYQTEAIKLAENSTDLFSRFKEYKQLKTKEEKQQYLDFLDSLGGFSRLEKSFEKEEYDNIKKSFETGDRTTGIYHGIHVLSAVMGLWIKMFGTGRMTGVMALMFYCSVFLFYYALKNLSSDRFLQIAGCALFAFSPVLLWLSGTTYSESLVVLSFTLFLYYLTLPEKDTPEIYSLGITTLYICSQHIMFLVLYPAFWLVFIVLAVREKNFRYFHNIIIAAAGLTAISAAFASSAVIYYFDNLTRLYIGNIITSDNILFWITAGAVVSSIVAAVLIRLLSRTEKPVIYNAVRIGSRVIIPLSLIYVAVHFYFIGAGLVEPTAYNEYEVYAQGWGVLFYTSIWALCLFCGILVLPFVVLKLFLGKRPFGNSGVHISICILVIWLVFVYSAVLKNEVWYYFYYSRYLGYVVPAVLLMFVILADRYISDRTYKYLTIAITAVSLIGMIVLDIQVSRYKDDTLVEWRTLESIAEEVSGDDAVLFSAPLALNYALALDNMTDPGVFPLSPDIAKQVKELSDDYDDIYILAESSEAQAIAGGSEDLKIVSNLENHSSYNRLHFIGGFSFENISKTTGITLIRCTDK